jgi:hypothetical protein
MLHSYSPGNISLLSGTDISYTIQVPNALALFVGSPAAVTGTCTVRGYLKGSSALAYNVLTLVAGTVQKIDYPAAYSELWISSSVAQAANRLFILSAIEEI